MYTWPMEAVNLAVGLAVIMKLLAEGRQIVCPRSAVLLQNQQEPRMDGFITCNICLTHDI